MKMEILINELSLHNQFETLDDFAETSLAEFVKMFSLLTQIGITPLKNYNFYDCPITVSESFFTLLTSKNINRINDNIRKYKSLVDKILNEPFWETNKKQDSLENYFWNEQNVNRTSLAEAFEREAALISFVPSAFYSENLEVTKENHATKEIQNFYLKEKLLKHLYQTQNIDLYRFCINYYNNTKLSFEKANKEKSFDRISDINDEIEFLNSFNLFCEMDWQSIISQGGKGENKVGLAYSKHHNQDDFKAYNLDLPIYKIRCSQKYRAFGYRSGSMFYILEFDLSHDLSD